jgi:uncharacterized membrane-anchored protein
VAARNHVSHRSQHSPQAWCWWQGYISTRTSRALLFWSAFILTRPLSATLGDLLDKPLDHGGFAFFRFYASAIAVFIVGCIVFLPQKAGKHAGA